MSVTTQILLRAARDRVIDLLGLGETYPLQDTAVSADRLTVAFDTSAKINIFPGQTDVTTPSTSKDSLSTRHSRYGWRDGADDSTHQRRSDFSHLCVEDRHLRFAPLTVKTF